MLTKKKILTIVFTVFCLNCFSQIVYEDMKNTNIYSLLDELATYHVISINSAIKPFSKNYIFEKLQEANNSNLTNIRLKKNITFYLEKYKEYSLTDLKKNSFSI